MFNFPPVLCRFNYILLALLALLVLDSDQEIVVQHGALRPARFENIGVYSKMVRLHEGMEGLQYLLYAIFPCCGVN